MFEAARIEYEHQRFTFVNVPDNTTEAELTDYLCSKLGQPKLWYTHGRRVARPVTRCRIRKGRARLTFPTVDIASMARLSLDGVVYKGHELQVLYPPEQHCH